MAYITLQDGTVDLAFNNGFKLDTDIGTILINRMFYIKRPTDGNLDNGYSGNLMYSALNIKPIGSLLMQIVSSNKTSQSLRDLVENEVVLVLEGMSSLIDSYTQVVSRTSSKINIDINIFIKAYKYNSKFIINTTNNTFLQI